MLLFCLSLSARQVQVLCKKSASKSASLLQLFLQFSELFYVSGTTDRDDLEM